MTREDIIKKYKKDRHITDDYILDEDEDYFVNELLKVSNACFEFKGVAEEFWQETPELKTIETGNGVSFWTDNSKENIEFKLVEGLEYTIKVYLNE